MQKLNNKGYLLIEIILVSTLAISIAYFMIELTLKLKARNDDILVTSLVNIDKGIIYNGIMGEIIGKNLSIGEVSSKIKIEDKKIEYNGKAITILNKYANFGSIIKDTGNNVIIIPINVNALPNENFDVILYMD